MQEIWKDIKGYEGLYQVSNLGRVKSVERITKRFNGHKICEYNEKEKILKHNLNKKSYATIGLCKDGKERKYKVHRLVAETFIPNPDNLPQINHKDENKLNNNVNNLEFCTNIYNANYGTRNKNIVRKLSKKVRCLETNIIYDSIHEAARKTGITYSSIFYCCKGMYKQTKGYHWELEDANN